MAQLLTQHGSQEPGPSSLLRFSPTAFSLPPLPESLTTFIGRDQLIATALDMVRSPHIRLLTFTGAGGVGKTRLALRIAELAGDAFEHGTGWVSLGTVMDPEAMLPSLAAQLGLRDNDHHPPAERLAAHLAPHESLLVIDNFEQVVTAAPQLHTLLRACPRLTLLVTSRIPLRISGEHIFPVPPMTLPPGNGVEAINSEAVRLFLDRAITVRPDITLTEATSPAIAGICARLDGLPLAIELAAARSNIFTAPAMLDRLNSRLPLLVNGPRDQPDRLRTMQNAIAWSYDLLTATEQMVFRRISVFSHGFTLQAAIAVADVPEDVVLASLGSLVEQSLLQTNFDNENEPRFSMLATICEFAQNQLVATGEYAATRERHAAYFVIQAQEIDAGIDGRDGNTWLARCNQDLPNLLGALQWLVARQNASDAVSLVSSLWRYWRIRGHISRAHTWFSRALELPGPVDPAIRADALWKFGYLHFYLGEIEPARRNHEESIALFATTGDRAGQATALDSLGTILQLQRDWDTARQRHEQALAIRTELGDRSGLQMPLSNLGLLAMNLGEIEKARTLLEQALAIAQEEGSPRDIANRFYNLGKIEYVSGRYDLARDFTERSLAMFEEIGDRVATSSVLGLLGQITADAGNPAGSLAMFAESLNLRLTLGLHRHLAEFIEQIAAAAVSLDAAAVTRWLAAADQDYRRSGIERLPREQAALEHMIEQATAALGPDRFASIWHGGSMTPLLAICQEIIDHCRAGDTPAASPKMPPPVASPPEPATGTTPLTTRELEILQLVTSGLTNRQIADRLFISPATVKRHVTNILAKLEVTSRAAAISYAHRHGLTGTT